MSNLKEKNQIKEEKELFELDQEDNVREIIVEKRSGFNFLEMIIIMGIAVLFGILIGSAITYSKQLGSNKINLNSVPEEMNEFVSAYQNILDNYYETLDKNALLEAGIEGMIDYLDDKYSVYMDTTQTEAFNEKVEGNYVGIGAEITFDGTNFTVTTLFEGSPGLKAGLQVGDIIKKVDETDVEGYTLDNLSNLIKGEKNSTVKIKVLRGEQEVEVVVVRNTVEIESVHTKIFEKNNKKIGYVQMDIFAANTAIQFKEKVKELEKQEIDSLIIDVRNNPGGHLTQVSEILSMFLEKGEILYQIETKGIKEPTHDWSKEHKNYEVAVLINYSSASASEILAAALKEVYGAHVVGITTYGKGTVQQAYELSSGAMIKYTTQKWLTPLGNSIDKVGVVPTLEVQLDEAYYLNPVDEMDNQLQKAIELLSE